MAAVDLITAGDLGPGLGSLGASVLGDVKDRLLHEVKRQGWRWYRQNEGRVLYQRKVLFWNVAIRVRDVRFILEELFGKEPLPT